MYYIKKCASSLKNSGISTVIGIGGGRTIDIAKYMGYLSKKEWISFPTILSHDGIVSSRAAITERNDKITVNAKEPIAVIVDTTIIKNSPYQYTAAGTADVVSNISSVEDWKLGAELGEDYNTVAAELALVASKAVISHVDEIKNHTENGINILTWSLICSGIAMNINGNSRPGSGSEHNFSHALEKLNSPLLHGVQAGLGCLISCYLQNNNWKNIRKVLKDIGIKLTAKELGVKSDMLIKALVMARNIRGYPRYTILDRYNIDEKMAKEILKNVGLIL